MPQPRRGDGTDRGGDVAARGEAYAHGDRSAAVQLRRRDDALDDLHVSLTAQLAASDISVAVAIEMGLVARFYERLGDHAVNVARANACARRRGAGSRCVTPSCVQFRMTASSGGPDRMSRRPAPTRAARRGRDPSRRRALETAVVRLHPFIASDDVPRGETRRRTRAGDVEQPPPRGRRPRDRGRSRPSGRATPAARHGRIRSRRHHLGVAGTDPRDDHDFGRGA